MLMYREDYHSMKKQWKLFSEVQLQRFRLFEEHRELIRKLAADLVNINEHYNEHYNAALYNKSLHVSAKSYSKWKPYSNTSTFQYKPILILV